MWSRTGQQKDDRCSSTSCWNVYQYFLLDVGVFLFYALNLTVLSTFFYYFHGIDPSAVFLPHKDNLGVVTKAKLTEHTEILESDHQAISLHGQVLYKYFPTNTKAIKQYISIKLFKTISSNQVTSNNKEVEDQILLGFMRLQPQMESSKELTPDQLKVRQIAQYYLELERRTEPLTHLSRFNPRSKRHPLTAKLPTDHKHFFALIVQMTYLLYSCHLKKINIFMGGQIFVRPPRKADPSPTFEVYIEYILDKEYDRMSQSEQQTLSRRFKLVELTKSNSIFGQFVCQFIGKTKSLIKNILEKGKGSLEIDRRQIDGLYFIIQNYLQNQIRNLSPSVVILSLEESQLFRQYSLLLKCFNNSLFVSINYFHASKNLYQSISQLEQRSMKKIPDRKNILMYAQHIETLLDESFRILLSNQIIKSQFSFQDTQKTKSYLVGDLKETSVENRKYTIRIFVKEKMLTLFDQEKLEWIKKNVEQSKYQLNEVQSEDNPKMRKQKIGGMKENDRKFKNQCHVQFHAAKNMIVVRYITNIELNIENTDNMMYHCNFMGRQWTCVSLQFIQKSQKSKKKERFLAFKTICYVNQHEKLVFKVMNMIDLLIVYAKVAEPLLRKTIINVEEYYQKTSQVNLKCDHIRDLFIRKIEESYWNISKQNLNI